jgi:16S rRNA (guanine(966)-N(2))-methyltransferase RsmD
VSLRLSGGRRLGSPIGAGTRPTTSRVRLAVMNLVAPRLAGARWLDLCSGSGVMSCEALQRGAASVLAVERQRRVADLARANLEAVRRGLPAEQNAPEVEVLAEEVLRVLRRGRGDRPPFDLAYADPPYAAGLYGPLAEALRQQWLAPDGLLIFEHASESPLAVPSGWRELDRRRYGGCGLLLLLQEGAA